MTRFLLILLTMIAAHGEWKRYVHTQTSDDRVDSPPVHNLGYFERDPCLRDEAERVSQCGWPEEIAGRSKTRTELRVVGTIGPLTVYDLRYFLWGAADVGVFSVLIGTSKGQLHEIFVREATGGTYMPTEFIKAGRENLIKMKFDDGGMYHIVYEDYFAILKKEVVYVDFGPVRQAAEKIVPNGMVAYQPTEEFDFAKSVFYIEPEKINTGMGPKVSCCEGRIEVPFKIQNGRVIPRQPKYDAAFSRI